MNQHRITHDTEVGKNKQTYLQNYLQIKKKNEKKSNCISM